MKPSTGPRSDPAKQFVRSLAQWEPKHTRIGVLLRRCEALGLFEKFVEADNEANRLRKRHTRAAYTAVCTGAAALILGIAQLWNENLLCGFPCKIWDQYASHSCSLWIEVVLILLATFAVVAGLLANWHKRWLLLRYKAERLRLLIFEMAIDPRLWTEAEPRDGDWAHWIGPRVALIEGLDVNQLANEAEHDASTPLPAPSQCRRVNASALETLVDFYSATWLDSQLEYFGRKVRDAGGRWWDRPGLATLAFALSVSLVAMHVVAEFGGEGRGRGFLMLSAVAPAAFTALRTLRSALENSRNAARAAARLSTLARYSQLLHGEDHERKPAPEDETWARFTILALSAALLESEQREWLRLMLEAEWFG
jgi:hypothetical protein